MNILKSQASQETNTWPTGTLADWQIRMLSDPVMLSMKAKNAPPSAKERIASLTYLILTCNDDPELIEIAGSLAIGETATVMSAGVIIEITRLQDKTPAISPYSDRLISTDERGTKIPSYGESSYGYDIRLGNTFVSYHGVPAPHGFMTADSDTFNQDTSQRKLVASEVEIPPQTLVLGVSKERIYVPRGFDVTCMAKSSIARMGIEVTVTPLETEWQGYVTLEIFNKNHFPVILREGIGITQLKFSKASANCLVSYADRGGKYQDQPAEPVGVKL